MIIVAFDFGIKNIGVAVGQNITCTSNTSKSIYCKNGIPNWIIIKKFLQEWNPDIIIVGLPIEKNKKLKKINKKVKKFAYDINKKFKIPVQLHNEELSTKEAKSILFDQGGKKNLKKKKIDALSAIIILESWFFSIKKL
ncbi:Holliday junction resolvase RuvX [Buchnera aphidicola (Kurisakia onigurumii)]|uniref:Holliday junction resolvase RuvX n=1 Tax=Buchnera aphidicola TaxID=9 RepID=UPI0031B6EED5